MRPGLLSLWNWTTCPVDVTAVKPSAAWAAEGAMTAAARAAVVRRERERDMHRERPATCGGHARAMSAG
jgi:hypothetical protein